MDLTVFGNESVDVVNPDAYQRRFYATAVLDVILGSDTR